MYTVPDTLVVPPAGQLTCFACRPRRRTGTAAEGADGGTSSASPMKSPIAVSGVAPSRGGGDGSGGTLTGPTGGARIVPGPTPALLPPALQLDSSAATAAEQPHLNAAPKPDNSADLFSIDRSVSARRGSGQRMERFLSESGLEPANLPR